MTLDKHLPVASGIGGGSADAADLAAQLRLRRNDLTLPALEGTPGCLLSRLSGRGATCFALYATAAGAEAAAARLLA